jgi:hypothetical protein
MSPDALKQIEAKMRQMQATGTVVTPEMMEAMYTAALKTGTDVNRVQAEATMTGIREMAETKRREHAAQKAEDAKMMQGIGGTIGNTALRYGYKWLDKKMNPAATPGGSATGEPLKTVGGPPMELNGNLTTVGGEKMTIGGQPTLMPEGSPLAGYGGAADMQALELAPSTLPGPVTTPPVTPGPFAAPSVQSGGAIAPAPAQMMGGVEGVGVAPIANTMEAVAPNVGLTELGASVVPTSEVGTSLVAEGIGSGITSTAPIAADTVVGTAAPVVEAGASTLGSFAGPAGFGAMGSGILGATGVRDDVGKAVLLGQGGETEQDIAGGVVGGAATGAAAGTWVFPGVGTAIGGIIGGVVGGATAALDDSCIIVTCCHGRHSEQVQIARDYRDAFMTPRQIRGYYVLADRLVPHMIRKPKLKTVVGRLLVNRLITFGRWATGRTATLPTITSFLVTKVFLGLCSGVGIYVQQYVRRVTGEVY